MASSGDATTKNQRPRIVFLQCGGTIDKCYPRLRSGYAFEFGETSAAQELLQSELKNKSIYSS